MDWKVATILSVGAVTAALVAGHGSTIAVGDNYRTVWHQQGGKVRMCALPDTINDPLVCTDFR